MSPLLRKEIRLLLPFWGIALALAIIPAFALPGAEWWHVSESCFWLFAFGLTLLGLAPFGQEFGWGTFSIMLAQPLERRRIWKTKFLLLLAAGGLVFLAFAICIHVQLVANIRAEAQQMAAMHNMGMAEQIALEAAHPSAFEPALIRSLVLLLMALTGGLWTTLLFRQTGAALWFAILIPGMLSVVVEGIFHAASIPTQDIALDLILIFYAVAGFVWARRMFARAQDSQWLGENIGMFSLQSSRKQVDSAAPRRKGALRALVRKEFQSHQISLLIAFGLLVLHICTLIFRGVYPLHDNSELRFAVEAVPLLWLMVPWLMGCTAIAEERKLGTMESQLCLPIARRTQFAIKLIVVLLLGIILGGGMPALIEGAGIRAGVASEVVNSTSSPGGGWYFATVFELGIVAGLITLVSLFASSLTRNILHGLGVAIVIGIAWIVLFKVVAEELEKSYDYSLWKGPLIFFVGVPVAILATLALSFSNYKTLHAGRRVWLRTLAIMAFTLVATGIATAFIYQRPWELTMSVEPQHGAPVLSGSVRPALSVPGGRICALLPDGRLWVATNYQVQVEDSDQPSWANARTYTPLGGTFVGGTNWMVLAANDEGGDVDAIQSDGTLWKILSHTDRTNSGTPISWMHVQPNPRRIGSESDWKTIISVGVAFLAVKTDGTLWGWGQNPVGQFGTETGRFEPRRIGTDSDWATLFAKEFGAPWAMKRDGSLWVPVPEEFEGEKMLRMNVSGADWLDLCGANNTGLVIKRGGTLWGWNSDHNRVFGLSHASDENLQGLVRLGSDSDWMKISGYPGELAAVKGGRLLKEGKELFANALGQPSRYSDWITVDAHHGEGLLGLAADGTLSMWDVSNFDRPSRGLLRPTHRPVWSLNILTSSKN